jgi:hypothetical protein
VDLVLRLPNRPAVTRAKEAFSHGSADERVVAVSTISDIRQPRRTPSDRRDPPNG